MLSQTNSGDKSTMFANAPQSRGRSQPAGQVKSGIRNALLPESTPVPNFFFDKIMPRVPHAEFKVLLLIWRKTVGWQKDRDFVSLTQIERGAGVCRDVAISGARLCVKLGLCAKRCRSGYRGTNEYEISPVVDKQDVINRLEGLVAKDDQSVSPASNGRFSPTSAVDPIDTQKATSQKATKQKARQDLPSSLGDTHGKSKFSEIPTL
jgi:hypothetical protein